ncbi:MAG: extracellular solute-binding protein [Anaerocolumna sp.]
MGKILSGKKKVIAVLLAALMLFSLAACGRKTEDGKDTNSNMSSDTSKTTESASSIGHDEHGYPDLKGETFTIWFAMTSSNAKATDNMEDYVVLKDLEKKFNCHLEFTSPPIGQESDNFSILMASDSLPDMIFCNGVDSYYPGGIEMAYSDGVLYDYTKYINDTYTPNFNKLVMGDDFLSKAAVDDQGRVVRLGSKICGSEDADLTFSGPLIRSDFLEKAGLNTPETIDDWTNMLTAMKNAGVEYPLAFDQDSYKGSNYFSAAFGIDDDGYYLKDDGKVAFGPGEAAYKDYLTVLHNWYEQGLINQDFSTSTNDDIMSMLAGDKVGSVVTHLWNYGSKYFVTTESKEPAKALKPANYPVLKAGDTISGLRGSSRSLGDNKYITADAKDPEACIALLDALYLDDIDLILANGVEGVGYEMQDNVPVLLPIPENATKEQLLSQCPQQWHTKEDTDLNYILTKKYNLGSQPDALKLWKEIGTNNTISNFLLFNEGESETISKCDSDIKTYVNEMALKFITGIEPLDNFDDYLSKLDSLHVPDMINVYQSANDRYQSR